jgi:hypothetical protein
MSGRQEPTGGRARTRAGTSVEAFLEQLEHPHKAAILLLRAAILHTDPRIAESVKWNAPSFALGEQFATFKLRPVETVQIVLHTGAKVKSPPTAMVIDDPEGLLRWAAPDRAIATFADLDTARAREAAFVGIVRQWIAQL